VAKINSAAFKKEIVFTAQSKAFPMSKKRGHPWATSFELNL